jgi:hypothetical protein
MFRAEAFARGLKAPPTLTHSQLRSAVERVRDLAEGSDLETAAHSLLKAAFDDAAATGHRVCFTLADCQPGSPAAARRGRGAMRLLPAPPAPHIAFDNQPDDAEIVLAKMLARKAERERLAAEAGKLQVAL